MAASAVSAAVPGVSGERSVNSNVALVPGERENGRTAGSAFHSPGTESRTAPSTLGGGSSPAFPSAPVAEATIDGVSGGGPVRSAGVSAALTVAFTTRGRWSGRRTTSSSSSTETGGSTTKGRISSPFTGSVLRKRTGTSKVSVSPPRTTSKETRSAAPSGRIASRGTGTA